MDQPQDNQELSPRERRHARTHQAILDAARTIIAQEGIDALSIRAIADRIDYSPAGLYEYFGGKDEIIGEVCAQGDGTLKRYLQQVDSALDPADYIVELGMAYVRFATQNPDVFKLIFTQYAMREEEVEYVLQRQSASMLSETSSFSILLQGVERAQKAGAIHYLPGLDSFDTAYALWAQVHGTSMLRITYLQNMAAVTDFDEADRLAFQAFVRGLATPPGAP